MKKLLFALLAISGAAGAQEAYVMPPGSNRIGDTIARDKLIYVLYTGAKCPLPIVNAEQMRRAEIYNTQKPDTGCWGKTLSPLGGSIVIIGPQGNVTSGNLTGYAKAKIDATGAATITAPAYALRQP